MNNTVFYLLLAIILPGAFVGITLYGSETQQSSQDASVKHLAPALSERDEIGRLKQKINFNGKERLGNQFIGASRVKDRIEIWKQTNLIRSENPKSLNALATSDCDKALRIFGAGPVNIFAFDPVDILYFDEQAPDTKLFRCDVMAMQERDRHIRPAKP